MKRCLLAMLCISLLGISYWENIVMSWTTGAENYIKPWEIKTIQQDLWANDGEAIQHIRLRFCNEMKEDKFTVGLSLQMRPWQRKEICMVFSNNWTTSLDIFLGFTEGVMNEKWDISCQNDMTNTNNFFKFISPNHTIWITVPANGNIIQRVTYRTPKSASGNIIWCASYKINQKEEIDPWKMFLVVTRKIAPITIIVTWSVYDFWRRDDMKDVYFTHTSSILKVIIVILALSIIVVIFQQDKKKRKPHKKK